MKLVPLGQNVVVRPLEPEPMTRGGLHLPEARATASQEGRVLSIGDGRLLPDGRRVEHQVHEGDRIIFANQASTHVVVDGEELLILPESNILAVLGGPTRERH